MCCKVASVKVHPGLWAWLNLWAFGATVLPIIIIIVIKMQNGCTLKKIKSSYIYCSLHYLLGEKMSLNYVFISFKALCRFLGKLEFIPHDYFFKKILFRPWLDFRKGQLNFSKDALVVILGWLADLNTFQGLVLFKHSNDIELINSLKWLFTGSQLIFLNSSCPLWALFFKLRLNSICLIWRICNFDFNLLFKLGFQVVLESYKTVCKETEARTCFFIQKSKSTYNFVYNCQIHWLSRKSFIQ